MKIYQISNLDCSIKENRKKLLKNVMQIIKSQEKPSTKKLEKICNSLADKYKIRIGTITNLKDELQMSIKVGNESYSCLYCKSYYEALLKYIMYTYAVAKGG